MPDQNSGKPFYEPFGLDLSALDQHTRPQDDFYQHANGAWIARTTSPADQDQVAETGNLLRICLFGMERPRNQLTY